MTEDAIPIAENSKRLAKTHGDLQALRCAIEHIEPLGIRGTRHERRQYTIVAIDEVPGRYGSPTKRFCLTVTCSADGSMRHWIPVRGGEYAAQQAHRHFMKDVRSGVREPLPPKSPNAILEAVRLYKADLAAARSLMLRALYQRQKTLGVTRRRREKILGSTLPSLRVMQGIVGRMIRAADAAVMAP